MGERFAGQTMDGAEFRDCSMAEARFEDINLSGASFANVDLRGARFDDVDMAEVVIGNARIDGLTIRGHDIAALIADAEGRAIHAEPAG